MRCTESVSNLHCLGSHTHTVSEYVCMRFVINLSLCQSSLTLIWISKFSSALCSLYLLWITTTTESTHFYTWTLGSERRTVNVFRNVCNCVIEFRIQWYRMCRNERAKIIYLEYRYSKFYLQPCFYTAIKRRFKSHSAYIFHFSPLRQVILSCRHRLTSHQLPFLHARLSCCLL